MGKEMNMMIDTMQEFMEKVKVRTDIVKNDRPRGINTADSRNLFQTDKKSMTTDMSSVDALSRREPPIERIKHLREGLMSQNHHLDEDIKSISYQQELREVQAQLNTRNAKRLR